MQRLRKVGRGILIDSGAGASVADGEEFPEFVREESIGSKKGQQFAGPGKELIPNLGQKKVTLASKQGTLSSVIFQDAKVRRPILAVKDTMKAGNITVFDQDMSALIPRDSYEGRMIVKAVLKAKKKIQLVEEDGVFVMPAWVVPPSMPSASLKAPFQRPGCHA